MIKNEAVRPAAQKFQIPRRRVLAGAAALPLAVGHARRADAAQFHYKFATGQSPTNPINIRLQEAINRIKTATGGQLQISLFPNNQLGSDTDLISQVRSGGIQFLNIAASVLSTVVVSASLVNVGFAFSNYDEVWKAVDGKVGRYILQQISAAGMVPLSNLGNNGFRQITTSAQPIRTPADLRGFKIRVPESPLFTSLFQALGAAPTSINFNELYTALQTHLVGGEENGLVTVETAKLYEVQKYCSLTNHIWDGFCLVGNKAAFDRLPPKFQTILKTEITKSVLQQRADETSMDASLQPKLTKQGMTFIDVDKAAFKAALAKTSFYRQWHKKFGSEAWNALETVSGKLG
jgi:tripartite ATP-independent transporter DctP family solute receptor